MADPHLLPGPSETQSQTPLLDDASDQKKQENPEPDFDVHLNKILQMLESYLDYLGFSQSSALSLSLSWLAFFLIGVALPVAVVGFFGCSDCAKYQVRDFEFEIVVSQACLAAASLLCLSHNLRKYGVRKFLFVDRYGGQMARFREQYIQKMLISSIVQVVGIILCLNAAAKISHRAQGIASIASKWHAVVTCSSADASQLRHPNTEGSFRAAITLDALYMNSSGSDLESLDHIMLPTNTQLASYMTSYHKRQALVMYLQTNPGGITVFGWTVDRGLISTIFCIELSLVLFLLGQTIVIASK